MSTSPLKELVAWEPEEVAREAWGKKQKELRTTTTTESNYHQHFLRIC